MQSRLVAVSLLTCSSWGQLPPPDTGDVLVSSSGNNRLLRLDFRGEQLGELSDGASQFQIGAGYQF